MERTHFVSGNFEQLRKTYVRQGNWHRENHNYIVADALYSLAFSVAQQIRIPENDENTLVVRIRTEQQAAFEMLCAGESGPEKLPLGKAQKVGCQN
jgi:hypothetical protein